VLEQLGRTGLGKKEAVLRLVRIVSLQIVSGEVDAYDGAKKIWNAQRNSGFSISDFCHKIDASIYAADEYEERPADREFFKQAIIRVASRWLEDTADGTDREE